MLNEKVKKYLDDLDQQSEESVSFRYEHEIAQKIEDILKEDEGYSLTKEDVVERATFRFIVDHSDDGSSWGTYYGPVAVLPNGERWMDYPSIRKVNQETLEYWTERSNDCKNPVLLSRYSDLVVDFSPEILNEGANISLFRAVIDSNIVICKKLLLAPTECETKIRRALALAIKINDPERISKVKDAVLELEKNVAADDKPGLWGFSFESLVLDGDFAKKVNLNEEERDRILSELEGRLKEASNDVRLAERIVSLLADYYAKQEDEKNLMRVLGVLESAFKKDDWLNSDALGKTHAYEQIHDIYRKYASRFSESEEAKKRLAREIGELDLDWNKSLKKISVNMKIEKKDIDDFIKAVFGEDRGHELRGIMTRLALGNLPTKEAREELFANICRDYPFRFLFKEAVISDDGIPIAKIPPLKEDDDGKRLRSHALHCLIFSPFFSFAVDELKRQFSKQKFFEFFTESLAFRNEDKQYLERAISAYWDNDYLVASHLLTPIIENGFRELVSIAGGDWLVRDVDTGGFRCLSLSRLLKGRKNAEILENMFSGSKSDLLFYSELILIDTLGMNLRNDFAHGLHKKKFFSREASDMLFRVLIWLSLIRERDE